MDVEVSKIIPKKGESLFKLVMQLKKSGLVHYILDQGIPIENALQDAISTQNYDIAQILFGRMFGTKSIPASKPMIHDLFKKEMTDERALESFLQLLLDNSLFIDINLYDSDGFTALYYALLKNYPQKILLKLLSHPNLVVENPIDKKNSQNIFHFAVKKNDVELLKFLLKNVPEEKRIKMLNIQNSTTPLHLAVKTWSIGTFANFEIIETLLIEKSNPILKNKEGHSSAYLAGTLIESVAKKILEKFDAFAYEYSKQVHLDFEESMKKKKK